MQPEPIAQPRKSFPVITIMLWVIAFFVIAILTTPKMFEHSRLGREQAAIQILRAVHIAQTQFQTKYKRYGSLQELAATGLMDVNLASKPIVYQYIFSESGISETTYCVQATRESGSTAYRDFNITESGKVQVHVLKTPAVIQRDGGMPLGE